MHPMIMLSQIPPLDAAVLARELRPLRGPVKRGDAATTRAILGELIPEASLALEPKLAHEVKLAPEVRSDTDVRARRRREGTSEQDRQPHFAVGANNS